MNINEKTSVFWGGLITIKSSFVLSLMLCSTFLFSEKLRGDTFDPATNILTIPVVQVGNATYFNVTLDLGFDFTVISPLVVSNSGGPSGFVIDSYDPIKKVLTIPFVSITGNKSYRDVIILFGSTFRVVSIAPGVGAGTGTCSTQVDPVNPVAYGAVGDGTTDNTDAFQRALDQGDILIPAGNYLVKGTVKVPTGRNIQCLSPDSVNIINPSAEKGATPFQFVFPNASLCNCSFSGTNDLYPNGAATYSIEPQTFNFMVSIVDYFRPVDNVTIINNVFHNCHANSCVMAYGGNLADTRNIRISNNTFKNCGHYSVALDAVNDSVVSYNAVTDCSMGIENDSATQASSRNNVFEGNYLNVVHGSGYMAVDGGKAAWHLFLTGGQATDSDYSSNIIRNNTVVGNGSADSIEIDQQSTHAAQYSNNTCTNGCFVRR